MKEVCWADWVILSMVMAGKFRVLESTLLYKGWSMLTRYVVDYRRENGQTEQQIREIYDSGDGAAVLLYDPQSEKILLVRQFRLAAWLNGHPDGFLLESCAGMLDASDPEVAIRKEIMEETGLHITGVKKIYTAFASPGAHMEKIHFFAGTYSEQDRKHAGGGNADEQEEIEVMEYKYSDIGSLLSSGQIEDAKTIILLQWALLHLVSVPNGTLSGNSF